MKDRLGSILQYYKINSSKLADILDVQRSGISHIMSGRNNPSYDFLVSLLEAFPEINAKWLMTGQGLMIDDADTSASVAPDLNDIIVGLESETENDTANENREIKNDQEFNDRDDYMSKQNENSSSRVEKVIILYSDGKFRDYHKE